MKRPQIVERIRKALTQVEPEVQAILYGSEEQWGLPIMIAILIY